VNTCFAPHSTDTLSDEAFIEMRVLADQLDLKVQIHLHESAAEIEAEMKRTGKRPLQRLTELGLVNASLLIVHGVHVTEAEIEQIANAGISVAHCPKSNLKLASGIAPVREYKAAGVNVALGTDGAASNNLLSIIDEMRTAALLAKAVSGDASVISAATALRMATLDGANALGLGHEVGSIEVGKYADLTCIDLSQINSQPVYDPLSQVVYTASSSQVSDVWVAGKQQLERGALTGIDTAELASRSNEWRQRIGQRRQ
jgi:5-methylthioadenosine/S-adenosylhomocysteine deaminase